MCYHMHKIALSRGEIGPGHKCARLEPKNFREFHIIDERYFGVDSGVITLCDLPWDVEKATNEI